MSLRAVDKVSNVSTTTSVEGGLLSVILGTDTSEGLRRSVRHGSSNG
jgi:hypothetical protein